MVTSELRLQEVGICREYHKLRDPSKIGSPPLSNVHERDDKLDQEIVKRDGNERRGRGRVELSLLNGN